MSQFFLRRMVVNVGRIGITLRENFVRERSRAAPSRALPPAGENGRLTTMAVKRSEITQKLDAYMLYPHIVRRICDEILTEFSWRLEMLSLVAAAISFVFIVIAATKETAVGLTWLGIGCLQGLLVIKLLRERRVEGIHLSAFLLALSSFLWWGLLSYYRVEVPLASNLMLGFLLLVFGSMPWPTLHVAALMSIGLLLLVAEAEVHESPLPVIFIGVALALFSLKSALFQRLSVGSRVASVTLASTAKEILGRIEGLRLLAWQLALTAGAKRVLLVFASGKAEVVISGGVTTPNVDEIFVRTLIQRVGDRASEHGIIVSDDLGVEFIAPFIDWFSHVPGQLAFFSLTAVLGEEEQRVYYFVPISIGNKLAGVERTVQALGGLASIAQQALSVIKGRRLSSDVVVATQRSLSEHEFELNQIIHHVNNIAQDISIHCDSLRRSAVADMPDGQPREQMVSQVERLEAAARNLAAGVSDVKLLREMVGMKVVHRMASVDVGALLEDLESFGRYTTFRKEEKFESDVQVKPGISVKVVSREFLETALRVLLRIAGRRGAAGDTIKLAARQEGEAVLFDVMVTGDVVFSEKNVGLIEDTIGPAGGGEAAHVQAIRNLCVLSGGSFDIGKTDSGKSSLRISLPCVQVSQDVRIVPGHWALLVDDKAEVATFYSRVADALNLNHVVAATIKEAEAVVESQGKPRLVITDIQLGDGNGIDFVKWLRHRYGVELPILVVSGNSEEGIIERARSAGATRFLLKPVGRKKLFSEIREVLAE